VEITVLLFASIAQAAGSRRLTVPYCDGDTVESVRARVLEAHPQLERFVPTLLYAIDEEYAQPEDVVRPGATVAFIPPVSGGCLC
jgi:molybdopterin converting factor subunit 1